MKRIPIYLLAISLFFSCQERIDLVIEDNSLQAQVEAGNSRFAISPDEALTYLQDFMAQDEGSWTKSIQRTVSSIVPIRYNALATKALQDSVDCENLLYIANFEADQGYAVLAADTRIGDPVLVITEDGSLSDSTLYNAFYNSGRVIYPDYPLTGPGFYTMEETGDELYMNPNTVCLYIEEEQDTLVGNFSARYKGEPTLEDFTGNLIVQYAVNKVLDYNFEEDDDFVFNTRTVRDTSAWIVTKAVSPLLAAFVGWGQDEPFNNLCPEKCRFGNKHTAYAGCFPLAIAKLMTYYGMPGTCSHNGYTIDWAALRESFTTTKGAESAAHLLRAVGEGCKSRYFYEGTFTFPKRAISYMELVGFRNAGKKRYSFERVTEMLDRNAPLAMFAIPTIQIHLSHCWNIDGYKIKGRTITTKTYSGDVLTSSSTQHQTSEMIHCDFGWKGWCNGYYVSGIFQLNGSDVEFDSSTAVGRDLTYTTYIRLVTYGN